MEPRIQYAKTSDDVNIAYWTLGEGPPLVHMQLAASNIQLEWQIPECRRWYERLAQNRLLVRHDPRGMGLSDRDIPDILDMSLEGALLDLEAVVDRLGLDKFALLGPMHSGPPAIAYAARHPERVSHLLLWCTYVRTSEWMRQPKVVASRSLLDKDWQFYTETLARVVLGWSEGEPARRFAELIRESVTPEYLQSAFRAIDGWDVSGLLPQVRSPTLVLHRRQNTLGVDVARRLVSGISNARLALLEGDSGAPYLGDTEAVLRAIDEFLIEDEPPREPAPDVPSGTAVILFADIVDSTGLTERLGDAAFREKARELDSSLRSFIRDNGGTPVEGKLVGDGLMAVFTSARQAIEAALRCGQAGDECDLRLHLGVHAGDVIREGNNVYGGAVNIASRISGLSAPGEVLVSDTVRGLARTSAGVSFEDRGEHPLKGIAEPMRLWAVRSFDSPSANASGGSG